MGESGERPPGEIDAVGPGAVVGRYVLEQEIGRGAMGVVYRAYDPDVDRRVALKVLHEVVDAPSGRARLIREAHAMARLSHPNIVRVHDAGVVATGDDTGALVYIAMDLVEGTTLRGWGARERPLADVLAVFVAAGRGLAAAHAAGLVHRDFKPDNVLLDERGHVFVGDFGLVRLVDAAGPRVVQRTIIAVDDPGVEPDAEPNAEVSRLGAVVGTPAYMAPEQLAGARVDDRADQFAFCVALWEAVYGVRPFVGTSIDRLVSAVMRHELAPVPAGRHVPAWLRRVLLRGLQAHPGDRFPAMDALLAELRGRPARRRALGWLAASATAGILAIGVDAWSRGRPCPGASVRSWNDSTRADLDLAASRWLAGDSVAPTIGRALDEWAVRWADAHAESCAASLVRGERSPAAWAAARACLEEHDDEATRLLAAFASGRVVTGAQAVHAVHALADPRECGRPGGDVVPMDPRLAIAIGTPNAREEGAARVRRAVEHATTIAAESELRAAVVAVEPLRSDRLAAHAWVRLVALEAPDPARASESARDATLAHAAVARSGDDTRLHADIDDARARGLLAGARAHEAIDHAVAGLAGRERALGARHPDVAASWLLLGRIEAARGDLDRALADDVRALAIVDDLFGVDHPVAASVALQVADDLAGLAMTDAAARWRARGLAVLLPRPGGPP